jgi:hypothetical protein
MTKTVLSACSVRGCARAAGAIINGILLCAEHAVEGLHKRKLMPQDAADKNAR